MQYVRVLGRGTLPAGEGIPRIKPVSTSLFVFVGCLEVSRRLLTPQAELLTLVRSPLVPVCVVPAQLLGDGDRTLASVQKSLLLVALRSERGPL